MAIPQQPPKDVVAKYLWSMWRQGRRPDVHAFIKKAGTLSPPQLLAVLRVDQHERWRINERPVSEAYLEAYPQLCDCPETFRLIYDEILLRQEKGELVSLDDYYQRFPQFAEYLWEQFQQQRPPTSEESLRWLASRANWEQASTMEEPPPNTIGVTPSEIVRHGAAAAKDLEPVPIAGRLPGGPLAAGSQTPPPADKRKSEPAPPPHVPGYEISGELGRGGMGVVYRARHIELNRLVALKMVRSNVLADEAELARFRAEGKVLAKLQHPNIVQIFEVGDVDGDPFFAVEFVDGGDLSNKLRGQLPQAKRAAHIVERLAEAIHYAHQQGIIHRDLKPANILIATDGSPKIVDFGLAKRLDASKRRTASGAIFGTPYYMAPEQAEGLTHDVGPTADVYALGAILYEMLTGRPPFRAASVLETLELVRLEEPLPPRQLQPGLPRDLETICLKCLQKDPKKRYASGKSLAADLGRYLRGEPILARPVAQWERTWRWVRRKPMIAGLLLALALSLIGGFTGVTVEWRIASRERTDALANFRLAREAVDRYLTQISEDPELKASSADTLRKRLLEGAKEFYSRLAAKYGDSAELQAELGRVHARLAFITAQTASPDEAVQLYEQAEQILEPLTSDITVADAAKRDLAGVLNSLSELYFDAGELDRARTALDRAVKLRTEVADAHADDWKAQIDLAESLERRGMLFHAQGQIGPTASPETVRLYQTLITQAQPPFTKALAILDTELRTHPDEPRVVAGRARCLHGLGSLEIARGRASAAKPYFEEALAAWERLGRPDPKKHGSPDELAMTCTTLGGVLQILQEKQKAADHVGKGVSIIESLAEAHPTITDYQRKLAMARMSQALLSMTNQRFQEAEKAFDAALSGLNRLIADRHASARCLLLLAEVQESRAQLFQNLQRNKDAVAALEAAVTIRDDLGRKHAGISDLDVRTSTSHADIAHFYRDVVHENDKAEPHFRRAAELMESVIAREPAGLEYRAYLASIQLELGILYAMNGKPAAAVAPVRRAVEEMDRVVQSAPADHTMRQYAAVSYLTWVRVCMLNNSVAEIQAAKQKAVVGLAKYVETVQASSPSGLGFAYYYCATQLRDLEMFSEALAYWERAETAGAETERPMIQLEKAKTLAHLGRHAETVKVTETLANAKSNDGEMWYQLAVTYAMAVSAAAEDQRLSVPDRQRLLDEYAGKGVAMLVKAQAAGFFNGEGNVARLKSNKSLDSLRARNDYRNLLEKLERK